MMQGGRGLIRLRLQGLNPASFVADLGGVNYSSVEKIMTPLKDQGKKT